MTDWIKQADDAWAELTRADVEAAAKRDLLAAETHDAARSAVQFLRSCVEGQLAGATVSERITAAQTLLQHAAANSDPYEALLGDLSDEDLEIIGGALE
jgi:hypothetical protein